ncbi:unnamed protein product [marine sediment metagenome]|uniref:Uncharacterized protein n=1 Tax=marine sediment metagenome TaxID=412755 RepID=X1KYD7_9ZZZZ
MSAQEILDAIDTVLEEYDLRPTQTIDTLVQVLEQEVEENSEENPNPDGDSQDDD